MMDDAKPRRSVEMVITIGADSRRELARALRFMAAEIERREINGPNGCSGAPNAGYHYTFSEDPAITHESYFKALDQYLAREAVRP